MSSPSISFETGSQVVTSMHARLAHEFLAISGLLFSYCLVGAEITEPGTATFGLLWVLGTWIHLCDKCFAHWPPPLFQFPLFLVTFLAFSSREINVIHHLFLHGQSLYMQQRWVMSEVGDVSEVSLPLLESFLQVNPRGRLSLDGLGFSYCHGNLALH